MVDTEFLSDDDMTPLPYLTSDFADTENQFSEELRIASPATGRFSYVAGLFYYDEHVGTTRASVVPPNTLLGPIGVTVTLDGGVSTQ